MVIGFGLIALVCDKFGGDRLKRVRSCSLALANLASRFCWLGSRPTINCRFASSRRPRAVFQANCRVRADCELALLSGKSVGEIPESRARWLHP